MINKVEVLIPEATYHIYNRANGNEKLFLNDENYSYFLEKYILYISPIAHTFCYCLMPNHFHFLIRIRSETELNSYFISKDLQGFKNLEGLTAKNIEDFISKQFSNFFNGYAKAFNKMHKRKGSLFMHTYKRKRINDENYLCNLFRYIHYNPIESCLCNNLNNWKYSSYKYLLADETTFLSGKEVINWFNDENNFRYIHSKPSEETINI